MKSTRTLAPAVPVRPAVATSAALLLAFTLFVPLTAAEDPHGHELTSTDPAGNVGEKELVVRRGSGKLTVALSASDYQFRRSRLPDP